MARIAGISESGVRRSASAPAGLHQCAV